MSAPDHDPLHGLPPQRIPEPSAARMSENIAASTELFARGQSAGTAAAHRPDWLERIRAQFKLPVAWMMPLGACAVALIAVVAVAPSLMQPTLGPSLEMSREPVPEVQAPTQPPRTMSMQPGPIGGPTAPLMSVERFNLDDLTIEVWNMPEAVELILLGERGESRIDFRIKDEAETFALSDGFLGTGPGGTQLLLLRGGVDGEQGWEAFEEEGDTYVRSGPLSMLITDAASRNEVTSRLEQAPQ